MTGCMFCERLADPAGIPGGAIYEDAHLHASHYFETAPAYLGRVLVQTKRHAAGLAELTDDEGRAFGLLSARIARALKASAGAGKVYAYCFGEAVPHFHAFLVARYPGVPKEYWRLNLLDWPSAPRGNADAVADLAGRLRAALHEGGPRTS